MNDQEKQLNQILYEKITQREANLIMALAILSLTERVRRVEKLVYGAVGLILTGFMLAVIGIVLKQ
jgi:lipopolysaccharide export LptBFGC system permease protein LptF